ncbi:MAG TPA: hypothetical protein ENN46_01920 [Candidatus Woesearchaeota archaeon]|nr:hypothetical protein [Candidatus Woesearchaeota archaeon]
MQLRMLHGELYGFSVSYRDSEQGEVKSFVASFFNHLADKGIDQKFCISDVFGMMESKEETHLNLDVLVEFSYLGEKEYPNQLRFFSHGFDPVIDKPLFVKYIKPAYLRAFEDYLRKD